MSALFEQQLKATGLAQVVVVLKKTVAASAPSAGLAAHFSSGLSSQAAALAAAHDRSGGGRGKRAAAPAKPVRHFPNLGIVLGTVDAAGLKALRQDKKSVAEVRSAPVFRLIRPHEVKAATTTPKTKFAWGIQALDVNKAWKKGFTGKGVLVGHLDTGCDGSHPVVKKAIRHWAFFDDFGNLDPSETVPRDTAEHGTHTAATIAGRPWKKGNSIFHVGIAPEAELATAAVIEGGDAVARVLAGMDWAIGLGVKVLSMSLGFPGFVDDFEFLTAALRDHNILPVFAVGNEGPGTSRSPGNYSDALSVGAVDAADLVADFSSSQRFVRPEDPIVPDLVAPGVDVPSAVPKKKFAVMSGTSMATPHIAGLAALLWQKKPSATVAEIEKAIVDSCRRPAGMLPERGNHGIPNALRALDSL
jgi:subtilisin family serine protease